MAFGDAANADQPDDSIAFEQGQSMHRSLLAPAIAGLVCTSVPADAAVILKTIDLASTIPLGPGRRDAQSIGYFNSKNFAIPAFDPRLGVLNSITIFFDLSRSVKAEVTRYADESYPTNQYDVVRADGVYFYDPLNDFTRGLVAGGQRGFTFPTSGLSTSAVFPLTYSGKFTVSAASPGFGTFLSQGIRVASSYGLFDSFTSESRQLLKLTSKGRSQVSFLYDYTIPAPPDDVDSFDALAVPEPATWAMLLVGFAVIGGALRRRRTASPGRPLAAA